MKCCECGCGRAVPLYAQTVRSRGWVRGEPARFVKGHNRRLQREVVRWLERDCGHETACWVWQLHITKQGYGSSGDRGGRVRPAHLVVWEELRGPVPPGLTLDHLCRNRACVNPAHLEPVTNGENSRRGDNAKLYWPDVEVIRQRIARGELQRVIAADYGVGQTSISRIKLGQAWPRDEAPA